MAAKRISSHAISRYRQRVEPLSVEQIEDRLNSPLIKAAISFGACGVKLSTGQRAIIKDGVIVTIIPNKRKRCRSGKARIVQDNWKDELEK